MALNLEISSTALVVIDLENGIVSRPNLAPHTGPEVVARARQLADAVRAKGGTVIWVHVLLNEVQRLAVDQPSMPPGTVPPEASELVEEAGVQPGDLVIAKRQRGAFYGTNLEQQLRRCNIRTIIMAGIATNIGVESTAREAFDRGYELVFAADAMSAMSAEMQEFALTRIFPSMGRVRSTEETLQAIECSPKGNGGPG